MTDLTIYTIGHSNQTIESFLDLLQRHGVTVVVDVRSAPFSRFAPHFNKDNLLLELKERGIGYRFAGEWLGGRPDDPDLYRNGVVPQGHADYLSLVDYPAVARTTRFREGIDKALLLAETETVALMCSEEDPMRCHRHHLIAQALLDSEVKVLHIRRDAKLEEALPLDAPVTQMSLLATEGD